MNLLYIVDALVLLIGRIHDYPAPSAFLTVFYCLPDKDNKQIDKNVTGHPALPGGLFCVIGNPTSDGTWTYTWEKGRQLKSMSNGSTTASFKYNSDGLRVQKTVGSVVTNYTLHGKNIVHMTQGSNALHFFYDASNKPAIVDFNGTKYAYVHNLQGDIVAILDSNGSIVVQYKYDAWGRIISKTGSLASTLGTVQPFRYRGYVFDEETGLYYLRSRFYCSVNGRFLNADVIYRGSLYTYCNNCPSVWIDKNGLAPMMCCFDDMGIGNIMVSGMFAGGGGGFSSTTVNDVISEYQSNASPSAGSFGYPPFVTSPEEMWEALVEWGKRHWIELTVGSAAGGISGKIFAVFSVAGHPIAGAIVAGLYFAAFNFIGSTVQEGVNSTLDNDYTTNPGQSGVENVAESFLWKLLPLAIGAEETALLENSWTWFNHVFDYLYLLVIDEE